jgi:tetratricopeptide (TPR) repeat protein
MAEIASFRQHFDEALEALGQVLSIDSVNLEGLMMTGDILYSRKISRSLDYYVRALRNYPENQKAAYALANGYIQEKRPEDAINICRLILASDSANIRFTKLLGYACYKAGI